MMKNAAPALLFLILLALGGPAQAQSCNAQGGAVNVLACGADPSGKKDSSKAFAAAVAAIPAGGTLSIPAGTFALSQAVAVNKPMVITCAGTIRPFIAPPAVTPFFSVNSGKVHFVGKGCVFDGISPAYKNFFSAVMAAGTNDFIDDVRVTGVTIRNLALEQTGPPYAGIAMTAVKSCLVANNRIENSGPNKSYSGGFAIYLQYTQDCTVSANSGDHLGGSFINDSASLRTRFERNKASFVTLFAYKGGYGTGFAISSAGGRPGPNAFTVADGNLARAAFAPGKYINILAGGPIMEGTVERYAVGTGILTIFMKSAMGGSPKVGDQIQPLSTIMRFAGNSCSDTGDNCYDINGWHDVVNAGAVCRRAGLYRPTGAPFGGLATCIWLGYDPVDEVSTFRGLTARITGTDADQVGGAGIMVTEGVADVVIENYRINNYNQNHRAGASGCAIALNPFNKNPNSRGADMHIGRGTVATNVPGSCMAWIENSLNNSIIGMRGTAPNGIAVNAGGSDLVQDNDVTATGTVPGTYAFLVGAGGGQHEQGVRFRGNRGVLSASDWPGGSAYGFWSQSDANTGIDVDGSNQVSAPNARQGFVPRAGIAR